MSTLIQDLRYGLRMLAKNPGFTAVAVVTLALGIGATSAIFTVFKDFLLRPLPFHDHSRLVTVTQFNPNQAVTGWTDPPSYLAWKQQNQVFEDMAAWNGIEERFNLTSGKEPERVSGKQVSSNFFSILGVRPLIGRTFLPSEPKPGSDRVAMVSYGLWQRRFGNDPRVLGKTLTLDDKAYSIVGVLPAGFRFSTTPENVWIPLSLPTSGGHGGRFLKVIGRLKPGVTLAQAQGEMSAIGDRLASDWVWNRGEKVRIESLRDRYVREFRSALLALLAAVTLIFLIACANVAGLLLARAATRQREIAIRYALGAARARIARQVITESMMLALAGGCLGLVIAVGGVPALYAALPTDVRPLIEAGVDHSVLAFTLLISLLSGVAFGTAPAWSFSLADITEKLKEGSRGAGGEFRRNRLRAGLVVGEITVALMLLIGATLLIRSFIRLSEVDPGFRAENVLAIRLARTKQGVDAFYHGAIERISDLPGVRAAGAVNILPMTDQKWSQDIAIEGQPPRPRGDFIWASHRSVFGDYFRAMGIRLLRGRTFTESDAQLPVATINETMARRFWRDEGPIGKRFAIGSHEQMGPWLTVVGVVADVKESGLASEPTPDMYFLETQNEMALVVRSSMDVPSPANAVRAAIYSVDPDQPISSIRSMEGILSESVAPRRLTMVLGGLFAGLALLLASVGLYGLISYSVSLRTHEIGVRMALGAKRGDVLKLVVGQGFRLTLMGVGIGIIGALVLTRFLSSLLYGVKPTDPATFAAVSAILTGVATLASYLPARRATKVDPMVALRYE